VAKSTQTLDGNNVEAMGRFERQDCSDSRWVCSWDFVGQNHPPMPRDLLHFLDVRESSAQVRKLALGWACLGKPMLAGGTRDMFKVFWWLGRPEKCFSN